MICTKIENSLPCPARADRVRVSVVLADIFKQTSPSLPSSDNTATGSDTLNGPSTDLINVITDAGSDSTKKFLPNPVDSLANFADYLNTLSTIEKGAVFHLLASFLILFSMFNIISALLGDKIIIYFKLETRFPKLAK